MKKILILLILTSCELIKPNAVKNSSNTSAENNKKPNIVKPTPNLPPLSTEQEELQTQQQITNQLWIENLRSQDNSTIERDDQKCTWQVTKIEINKKGDFTINADKLSTQYKFINAIDSLEANYIISNQYNTEALILKIKPIPDDEYQKLQGFDDRDKYQHIVERVDNLSLTVPLLYRSVPNEN